MPLQINNQSLSDIPDDVIEFVSIVSDDVYKYSDHMISEVLFINDYRNNDKVFLARRNEITLTISTFISRYDFTSDIFNTHNAYIRTYKNCSVAVGTNELKSPTNYINYLKSLMPDETPLLFKISDIEGSYNFDKSLFVECMLKLFFNEYCCLDHSKTFRFYTRLEIVGLDIDFYCREFLSKTRLGIKIGTNGIGKIAGNKSTAKGINIPDNIALELNNYKISKKSLYKQNPKAYERMDKWTIGF